MADTLTSLADIRNLSGTELRYVLMDLAKTKKDSIALGRGDPDLPTPAHIMAAAYDALQKPTLPESPTAGLPELRVAIASRAKQDHGITATADNVLVTTGGQEALFLVMAALLNPGDEILVPDPRYTSYDQAIEHAGGVMVSVPTSAEDGFDVSASAVAQRITPKTKAILLVTPSNPTGGIVTAKNAAGIAELAREHDLVVIADEIYGQFVWEPFEHVSIAALPDMQERTITLSGFSKAYAMTGWRVGYVIAPEHVINALTAIKQVTTGAAASLSQLAALAAAQGSDDCIHEFRAIYQQRRTILAEGLTSLGLTYAEPRGGFFFWTDGASSGLSGLELCYLLLQEAGVLIFPGTAFGETWANHLRITCLQSDAKLQEAIERMQEVFSRHGLKG